MDKLVVFNIVGGSFEQGFNVHISVRISSNGNYFQELIEFNTELSSNCEIPQLYRQWQSVYYRLERTRNVVPLEQMRIVVPENQITHVSTLQDCRAISQQLQHKLDEWLNRLPPRDMRKLLQHINPLDYVRFLIKTQDIQLQKLPWHLCSLFNEYPNAEVSLAIETACYNNKNIGTAVKILAIFGNDDGIDINHDENILRQLEEQNIAMIQVLKQPDREKLNEELWKQQWDILFFAGHSSSHSFGGRIHINANDSFSLHELEHALRLAARNGLKLAIFNSCDGLGLLSCLASVNIPYTIVMREPIPDRVAHIFLKYFLEDFAKGKSLHSSVKQAREKLQGIEYEIPCATWLPVIAHNSSSTTLNWFPNRTLVGIKQLVFYLETCLKIRLNHKYILVFTVLLLLVNMILFIKYLEDKTPKLSIHTKPITPNLLFNTISSQKPAILSGKSQGLPKNIEFVIISPDKKFVASKKNDNRIDLWNLETKQLTTFVEDSSQGGILAFSPSGKFLASAGFNNSNISIYTVPQGQKVTIIKDAVSSGIRDMVYTANEQELIIIGTDNTIKIWNFKDKVLKSFPIKLKGKTKFLAVSNNVENFFIGNEDGDIDIWNLVSGQLITTLKNSDPNSVKLTYLSLSPEGKKMIAGFQSGNIQIWNLESRRLEYSQKFTHENITSVAFTQDRQTVMAASSDWKNWNGYIYLWRLNGNSIKMYKLADYGGEKVTHLFDTSRGIFAIGFYNKDIKIWNISN